MKSIAIIQARMSSTRLPGKVMLPLAEKPIIWHIWNRAKRCKLVDEVVVATSGDKSDDQLVSFCEKEGICCIRGSLDNVLDRFFSVLKKFPSDYIVRITGDCPLIHPPFIDVQLEALQFFDGDHTWCKDYGCAFEGQGAYSVRSLKLVRDTSNDPVDQEHVGAKFFTLNPDRLRIVEVCPPSSLIVTGYRLTVDEPSDYEMFKNLFDIVKKDKDLYIDLQDALSLLEAHPEIAEINSKVIHKKLNLELQALNCNWNPKLVGKYPAN
jgi:spore coat polysaccharide biosynthesis protein SpsF